MPRPRKNYTPPEKVAILKRHLLEKVAIPDLCEELGLNPTVFYHWQKVLFENGAAAFERISRRAKTPGPPHRRSGTEAAAKERSHRRTDGGERPSKKSTWGTLKGRLGSPRHPRRNGRLRQPLDGDGRTDRQAALALAGPGTSKFYDWKQRYGKANEHNGKIPRDHWLEDWEKQAIVDYHGQHPQEGYRRLTYMMLDADVVAVSPATVYRVLKQAGLLGRARQPNPRKGKGFVQPLRPHRHWHIDISYLNIAGTFYFLISVLDGYSRFVVHQEIRESMLEDDVQIVVQRAKEKIPQRTPADH